MAEVRYDGPYEAVEIPSLNATVKKGEKLKVSDEKVRKSLLEQDFSEAREQTPAAPKARPQEG